MQTDQTGSLIPIFTDEGFIIDDQTGEIIGMEREQTEPFRPTDQQGVEWVLAKMQAHELEIAKLELQRDLINKQIDRMERIHISAGKYLHFRFAEAIIDFAHRNLKPKSKTWSCLWADVKFRATKATVTVLDEPAAILWAESACPEAVAIKKSFLKSKLPNNIDLPKEIFAINQAHESATINTNIKELQ